MNYFFEEKQNEIQAFTADSMDFDAHLHEHIEFGYILSGSCDLYIEDKCHRLSAGDVFIIFPNQIHRYDNSQNIKAYVIICSADLLSEFKNSFLDMLPQSPVISENTSYMLRLFDIFFDKCAELPFESQRGIILALIGIAMQNMTLVKQDRYNISTVKNMLIFCNSHYSEPITINDVADNLHISRSHAAHVFQNKLNTSFSQYINNKRVGLACDILKNTHMSVTQAAFASGFSSLRTFNRTFAKFKGCTPREYRMTNVPSK